LKEENKILVPAFFVFANDRQLFSKDFLQMWCGQGKSLKSGRRWEPILYTFLLWHIMQKWRRKGPLNHAGKGPMTMLFKGPLAYGLMPPA